MHEPVRALIIAFAAALASAASASAGDTPWQAITRQDAEAALAMIEQNHPGARPEVGDKAFLRRLETARAHVAERLPLVTSYAGYSALIQGLANDFADGHIRTNALVSPARIDWTGLVTERRGGQWFVAADTNPGAALKDARLVSCDGIGADRLGRDRIGQFRANPAVEAAMARSAYALFIDDGAPFLKRPATCRFELPAGEEVDRSLAWRAERVTSIQQSLQSALTAARAGMGVRPMSGGGYWIALESLGDRAEAVASQVEGMQAQLRAAPLVVLDLRGNGGGNSDYTDRIAKALAGKAAVDQLLGGESDCQGQFWRASPENGAALRALAKDTGSEQTKHWFEEAASGIEDAIAARHAFYPDLPACASRGPEPVPAPPPPPPLAMKGRLVLLTDRSCFSSCLLAAELFRDLGALHVGEATDLSTRYMEVRDAPLPSGLRTFSTLMKLSLGSGDFGPYEPQIRYPGSLADTAAVEKWVIEQAAGK